MSFFLTLVIVFISEYELQKIPSRLDGLLLTAQQARKLSKFLSKKKALDHEYFALYDAICLERILNQKYLNNFYKLVKMCSLLIKTNISKQDIEKAEYCKIYSIIIHTVCHWPAMVKQYGSLNVVSSFFRKM